MPKVSVIVPTYNVSEYLDQALESLVKQTLDDLEIICVNDGSTDNSSQIAKEWGTKVLEIGHNKGLANAFRAGIQEALKMGADIIVNTDADNQYNANDIEKLVRPILDGEADEVIGRHAYTVGNPYSPNPSVLLARREGPFYNKHSASEPHTYPDGNNPVQRERDKEHHQLRTQQGRADILPSQQG